ncbi:outer membrane beta-barrel protein [Zobellia barbeyronii]|uniref:PorT family protein n=1 Tax=Zobellia barbeyronii TaxID=2748009 RepID=A0ABS5WIA3_9FLAO|nr:outer membrane beta-barrel protein [Zobellia barbeyronii]MBT2163104.1 PorT family protein [Zobellia barbeyronii]
MKNSVRVLMILLMVSFSFSANAQIFGVKAGLGLSNITSPDEIDNNVFGRALGVKIGGTIEFDITDDLYVGSGLSFAKRGASTVGNNYNTFYLELPVSARYDILEVGGSGYLYATSGLNLGVLLAANRGGNKVGIGTENDDFFRPLDFGLNFGFGVIFAEKYEIGLLTEFGLKNIYANDLSTLRNSALLVSFGYKFGM